MQKFNDENERIKRYYLHFLGEAKRRDQATVDKVAAAIKRFEASTGFKSFKRFNIEQAVSFKRHLAKQKSKQSGKPLSKATIDGALRSNKAFFFWLAGQTGYKSRIAHSDADYFNTSAKDARIAHAHRDKPYPTMAQAMHAFQNLPDATLIERRNKALFAFLMLTGARDGAIASLRLKRIDLVEGCVYQDARDVKTKNAKTFTTWFLPVNSVYQECFETWVRSLREELLFGNEDALFPKPKMEASGGAGFRVSGLSRENYANSHTICAIIKDAFIVAGLPPFTPHSFRKTLVKWADTRYPTREAFKAFSQNIGHDSVVTTISAYCPVSSERQAELLRNIAPPKIAGD